MNTDIFYKIFNRLLLPVYPFRMYMHKHKCLFIHIPKNAGTSILSSLGHSRGRDHVEWRHYVGANPKWFENYHKFAICRHPMDRLLSAYQYAKRGGNKSPQDMRLKKYIDEHSDSFISFVDRVLDWTFIQENLLFKPQYLFVYDGEENIKVDTLLRFESLSEDWRILAEKLGVKQTLGKENTSANVSLPELSELLSAKVNELYEKDFRLFGYAGTGI